ncbi:MAG: protein kinase [Acidobacteria bacterium]|nr:protein kinase [Acidobacteriota bacterium]
MRESVGAYRLLEHTGEDRLGELHRARDTARGRTVIVRVIHPALRADPARRAALVADASKMTAISHPAVAALFDVVDSGSGADEGDDLALVHEHVDGKTLAATLGGTPLNPRLAAAIAIQIADGLAELHAAGWSHGAVDAAHVAINPRGQAKLLDAGLTHWLDPDRPASDDVAALGSLIESMTGRGLPKAQWADDLRAVIARTRADHPRRFESIPTLAAELRSVSAMLEARADAAPMPRAAAGRPVAVWFLLAVTLLALGAWFLTR